MTQVEVRAEDQQRINEFGNLNSQCTALKMDLEALEKKKRDYEDSHEEVELLDGMEDTTLYQMGTTFIEIPLDTAMERIDEDLQDIQKDIESVKGKIAEKEARMAELRSVLYGRFGRDQINLGD